MAGTGGDHGISKGPVVVDGPKAYFVLVFLAIAIYNVIELTFILFGTFKRYSGVYFWSFVAATYGILLYSIGFLLKNRLPDFAPNLYITFIAVGWVAMVTGQSMVLWSRLHLVLRDTLKIRLVLYMIIVDAIIMHIPIIVMVYGANSNDPSRWIRPYSVYEKIQISVFFIQELIISTLYIIETVKLSRLQTGMQTANRSRRLMRHLIIVNVIVILLDITILGLEYASLYLIQTSYKALVYSAKLKLEFSILNSLVEMTTGQKELSGDLQSYCSTGAAAGVELKHNGTEGRGRACLEPDLSFLFHPAPGVLCRAYAHGGNGHGDTPKLPDAVGEHGRDKVVMTTDIIVHREARSEADIRSVAYESCRIPMRFGNLETGDERCHFSSGAHSVLGGGSGQ